MWGAGRRLRWIMEGGIGGGGGGGGVFVGRGGASGGKEVCRDEGVVLGWSRGRGKDGGI